MTFREQRESTRLREFLNNLNREQPKNTKLKEFMNNLKDEADNDHEVYTKPVDEEYNTVVRQLNSISWQLKRIADLLENTTKDS